MSPKIEIENGMIISALNGLPITGLVENWSFTLEEVAPYVFKAHGTHLNRKTVNGYGGGAEDALLDCIGKAEKINRDEQRKIEMGRNLVVCQS